MKENDLQVTSEVKKTYISYGHLISLIRSLKEYFLKKLHELVAESISKIANYTKPSTVSEYENLIVIKCSSSLKQKFESKDFNLNNF